jgi:hypothetical protein
MINKHEISIGVYWDDVGVLAEGCQGDRTQGQKISSKTAKITVEVHSMWHTSTCVAIEAVGSCDMLCVTSCACANSDGPYTAMHEYHQKKFFHD